MRFVLVSNVRLHDAPSEDPPATAPVLVVAGDLGPPCVHSDFTGYAEYIQRQSRRFACVLLVAGNHEYYTDSPEWPIPRVNECITAMCAALLNVHFLSQSTLEVMGVRWVGCTLWSRISTAWEETYSAYCNDARLVHTANGPLTARRRNALHRTHRHFLASVLCPSTLPTVVITHHAPAFECLAETETLPCVAASACEPLMAGVHTWCHAQGGGRRVVNHTCVVGSGPVAQIVEI